MSTQFDTPMGDRSEEIYFTVESVKQLRKLYKDAVDNNKADFVFQEKVLVTDYAKYLLEYIDMTYPQLKTD